MDPIRDTILALTDDSGQNELLDALKFTLEDLDPNWVDPLPPKPSVFKDPINSFEQFQAAIKESPNIFRRPALQKLYTFVTESSGAKESFVVTNTISLDDRHQIWRIIHAGVCSALRSVRTEFEAKPAQKKVQTYLDGLACGDNKTLLLFSIKGTHHPLNATSVPSKLSKGKFKFDWDSTYDEYNDSSLGEAAFGSMTVNTIREGVKYLLDSLEKQMGLDQNQAVGSWNPRNLGITILQTYVDTPELKSSIWRTSQSVGSNFLEDKIVRRLPPGLLPSHSGWQFFMSGAGDITNPHIDPPLTRSLLWQVIGSKLWCIWPGTNENLAVFEQSAAEKTWKWAMDNLSESGRRLFIMEPGTWCQLKHCEIHACISLSPSVHASQEFFCVDDTEEILKIWKATEGARENSTTSEHFAADVLPEELTEWLPTTLAEMDPSLDMAIELYNYGRDIAVRGKSDQVTLASEVCSMLPLVRDWIIKETTRQAQL